MRSDDAKWMLGIAVAVLASTSAGVARAADTDEGGGQASADGERPESEAGAAKHETAAAWVDAVLGWGKVPFAVQTLPAGGLQNAPTYSRADRVQSNVQSFLLGLSFEPAEGLDLGLRVPLTWAGFSPDGSQGRSTFDVGNLELEGGYGGAIATGLRLSGSLGVALPLATGDEIPAGLANASATSVDQASFDRWSLSRAAEAARGYEDNALFEPNRLGIVPKVSLLYRTHGLSIEPYLELENLIGTSSSLANGYVGELVGALRVGYWIQKEFEVAARAWFNAGFAGPDEDKTTSAAVEPQIVLRFGPVRPYVGFILPVAGPPDQESFLGAHLGAVGVF